jgi:hypothetical protein
MTKLKNSSITSIPEQASPKLKTPTSNKKVVLIKKNLNDPTAAFVYGLGVSIAHLALLITINFVQLPDDATIDLMSEACKSEF